MTAGLVHPAGRATADDVEAWDYNALHPQTIVATGMNGTALPATFGGPLRIRVPRQLGYKSVKYLRRLEVVEDVGHLGQGVGGSNPEIGYAWDAGI